jgi:NAD(P)-dependent dehydrogenase (short-subunit alcohol dehydrogenase family)
MIAYKGVDTDYSLKGRTAIITGGAQGIGKATAEFFTNKGVNVVIADMNADADKIAKAVGPKNIGVSGNICEKACRDKVLAAAVKAFGAFDILVNCAGIARLESAEKMSEAFWDDTIAVNLTANFKIAQACGAWWIEHKRPGSIVFMASQAGVVALDKHVAYASAKGGIMAMTKVLALEWGKYGIRVNAVAPTIVLTDMGHKAWDGPVGDAFKTQIPAGRFAEPAEVAATIAYLCSDNAAMITGHNLVLDGGYTIR